MTPLEDETQPIASLSDPHFDIDASIVFQLGESLITDPLQAVAELIKNSYDAGATEVIISIDTRRSSPESAFPDASGYIEIRDTGIGMDRADLVRGWLTISASPKRRIKETQPGPEDLPQGRFPLGDKGLGRLGVQRLGGNLEIYTRPTRSGKVSDTEYRLAFSWDEFRKVERLSEVHVSIEEHPAERRPGTSIIVTDLKEVKVWEDAKLLGSLEGRLAEIVTPFVPVSSFEVQLVLNGKSVDLPSLTQEVLNAAMVQYDLQFQNGVLEISGRVRMNFMRPGGNEDAALFHELVERDSGANFLSFLSRLSGGRQYKVRNSIDAGWFVEINSNRVLAELDGVEHRDGRVADPGPFTGKIYFFDFRRTNEWQGVLQQPADLSSFVQQLSGVHVYRDGFGVRTGKDWLRIGEGSTKGTSYYGLRPQNTLGYVAISSRENAVLEETTDREGFKDTAEYRNFYALLRRFVQFANGAQEFLRRGWLQYKEEHTKQRVAVPRTSSPESRAADLIRRIGLSAPAVERIRDMQATVTSEVQRIEETYRSSLEKLSAGNVDRATINRTLADLDAQQHSLRAAANEFQRLSQEAAEFVGSIEQLRTHAEIVQADVATLRTQLREVYEMVSLGLTAEALSHEIGNVLNQLSERTRVFRTYLKGAAVQEPRTLLFADYVANSVLALRKQLAHLAPSLRYVREQRMIFRVGAAVEELASYYSDVFGRRDPLIKVTAVKIRDFSVRINRGKLTQVLDNLVLNSEYWLLEDARVGRVSKPQIYLRVEEPFIRVSDNGSGVDPELESTLFEPFVSGKAPGTGRGLGLFIVQQLLEAEGCGIALLPDRNSLGRRYIFQIDLSGALHAGAD